MKARLHSGATRRLLVLGASSALSACGSLPGPLQTHSMPVFSPDRVQKIGEPIGVVMVGARKLESIQLTDGRIVQAIPVFLQRHRSDDATWSELKGAVAIPLKDVVGSEMRANVYVIGRTDRAVDKDFVAVQALPAQKLMEVNVSNVNPDDDLRAKQDAYLAALDAGVPTAGSTERRPFRSADVLLVCVPRDASVSSRCFEPGGQYTLAIHLPERNPADFPFRMERRNGVLGALTGAVIIFTFLILNTA